MDLEMLEMQDVLEDLNSLEEDILSGAEYENIGSAFKPEIRHDVPGVETAIVSGDPEGVANVLDYVQGDEIAEATGTCALTSISNICKLSGMNVTEGEVIIYAMENDLCDYDPFDPSMSGGTTDEETVEILQHYGISASAYDAEICSDEMIAEAIESGKGVLAGVDAGVLWNDPKYTTTFWGTSVANHEVTMTGVARDAETGQVVGFYICDSGDRKACQYVDVQKLHEMCHNICEGTFIITDEAVRVI